MNKNIIIAIIIIILIAAVGAFVLSQQQGGKVDTQINFLGQTTAKNGDTIQFELKDAQGNIITGQQVNITFAGTGDPEYYTVITDTQGKAGILISDEEAGNYTITVSYPGDDKHNGCSVSQVITVEDGSSDASSDVSGSSQASSAGTSNASSSTGNSTSTSSSSGSSSNLNYDSELNVYYDDNGKIVGGQNDGNSYEYIKNNHPTIDEEGNLV